MNRDDSIHFNHLHRIVGRCRAFDLLFTGRVFDAREAMALGLVSRLAPEEKELSSARELAVVFAGKSPELMCLGKAAFGRDIDSGYRQGAAAAVDLVSTVLSRLQGRALRLRREAQASLGQGLEDDFISSTVGMRSADLAGQP
ncbi:enoyl-CoA hydratase/isomerase family protein, partial [Reyranella sp.]|uniref:enoyl-CoA hydratase/isomerase family protein n=1 Tax=Reyranella sp. TaxID=1929291 RepID=UPI003D0B34E5